jgi:CubicO group peptidase (beta-lactamase class C family)/peptidoglycan/xylan/chitin deacetylase (PgdA/CDA1 family)
MLTHYLKNIIDDLPRLCAESCAAITFVIILNVIMPMLHATELPGKNPTIQLAITLDDLPWVGPLHNGDSAQQALQRIAAVLRVHLAPATGFVVCDGALENEQPLLSWVAWGLTLGNHSAAHRDINRTPVDDWLADVARCDDYLKKFGSAYQPYFRFPMLHQGDTEAKKNRVESTLQEMGLRTAHITVDNSEWILARAYASALANNNADLRYAIGRDFIRHIVAAVEHADGVARRKTGRSVPHILLLHANTLVENNIDALLLELHAHNVEFISLEEALADPVYSRSDEFIGPKGLSWLYRMQPLSIEDVQWDDAEAAAIRQRFANVLAGNAEGVSAGSVSSRRISPTAPKGFEAISAEAGESERMRSLLVMHRGELIMEAYFNGAGPDTPVNLKSVTKTLTSTLIGNALRKGWIESVHDPIGRYMPERFEPNSEKASITIHQLLTMSSGLQPVGYGRIQRISDWVESLLAQPFNNNASGSFVYDTPVLQLLTAILSNVSGMSVRELAQQELLTQLDGLLVYWRCDSKGIEFGGNDAYLLPRDLIKLGELYRLGGSFKGREILSEEFVYASTAIQIKPKIAMVNHHTLPVRGYGYLWWLLELNGESVYAVLGHGGQILLVSPQRDLVVLMTSRWPGASSAVHYRHLTRILVDRVLPLFPLTK